jgi:hypothetical protein
LDSAWRAYWLCASTAFTTSGTSSAKQPLPARPGLEQRTALLAPGIVKMLDWDGPRVRGGMRGLGLRWRIFRRLVIPIWAVQTGPPSLNRQSDVKRGEQHHDRRVQASYSPGRHLHRQLPRPKIEAESLDKP